MVQVLYVPQITYVGRTYKLSRKLKYLFLFGEYLVLHCRILALSGILLSIQLILICLKLLFTINSTIQRGFIVILPHDFVLLPFYTNVLYKYKLL